MRRIEFGIGIGKDHAEANAMIGMAIAMLIVHGQRGGFVTRGEGFWKAPDGRVVREEAITITLDTNLEFVDLIADNLRRIFNQESIHIAIFDEDARNT